MLFTRLVNQAREALAKEAVHMDTLRDCIAKYLECETLIEVESKKDPENEPYRSKYKAITILMKTKDVITKNLESLDPNDLTSHFFRAVLSGILGQIGTVYLETEEFLKAEEYFMNCLTSISDHLHPDCIIVSIVTRNQLGFLWSHRSQSNEAKKWLEGAEKLYKDFRCNKNEIARLFYEFEVGESKEGEKVLEMAHTLTKFYLAQIYRTLNELLKSAIYYHETLRRELMYEEYDCLNWSVNSAMLSQVFMERTLFKQARHHLAAASCILDIYEKTLKEEQNSQEEMETKREEYCHRVSDVSRFWAKYGIFLLEHSKNLLSNPEEKAFEEKNEELENLWFDTLDLSLYESQITDSVVVAFEDAREVFLITQKHLNIAKQYYTLEDRASDHVQIVQDHSQLFRHLTAFEPNEERQFKMMKKRVDMLKEVLKELNPRYYLDVCRQLWFELGETYHDMMQIKFQTLKDSNGVPTPQLLMKINALAESSIANFNNFLNSINNKKSEKFLDSLPEELIEPTLIAHFYLGRLYYKYITQDVQKQLENTTKACECFKFLVDSCENNEKAKNSLGEELNISKEMMTLLQMKALQL